MNRPSKNIQAFIDFSKQEIRGTFGFRPRDEEFIGRFNQALTQLGNLYCNTRCLNPAPVLFSTLEPGTQFSTPNELNSGLTWMKLNIRHISESGLNAISNQGGYFVRFNETDRVIVVNPNLPTEPGHIPFP